MPAAKARPAPAKTASKPVQQTARTAAPVANSKAAQAARYQGRIPEPDERKDTHGMMTGRAVNPKASVPATRTATPPADFGSRANLPDFMRGDAGMGKENIGREDLETPRLKLIQGQSPELQAYDDLRPGNFLHSAAEFIFDAPFRVVPLYMDRRYILWRPRDAGGGILARADDGVHWWPSKGEFEVVLDKKDGGGKVTWKLAPTVEQSGLANWGTMNLADPNSPPAATLMYTFVFAFPDEPDLMPAAFSFQRSSIKMGRRFNTKLKTSRVPLFGLVFTIGSTDETNGRGQTFQNVTITGAGLVEDEGLYQQYKDLHMLFKEDGLAIKDIESLQTDDPEAEGNQADDQPQTGKNKY